jgi:hypothetical protein
MKRRCRCRCIDLDYLFARKKSTFTLMRATVRSENNRSFSLIACDNIKLQNSTDCKVAAHGNFTNRRLLKVYITYLADLGKA